MAEIKLAVRDLSLNFKTDNGMLQAVRDISFDLYKGETLAIVGESGSGKSVTNRAIIGVLANNAVVESGEIIYDGQDLLKIPEEDFHKIRGDKIAMIFQDPMSSLNPIMRVGKQLTEAMILKSSSTRRNARNNFNSKLKLLLDTMDEIAQGEEQKQSNKLRCKTFDDFCINGTKLESAYNDIYRKAVELQVDIDNTMFLIEKKQNVDLKKFLKNVVTRLPETKHPDILVVDEALQKDIDVLTAAATQPLKLKDISDEQAEALRNISAALVKATGRPKPNYFTLGYYTMKNPDVNVDDMPIEELTEMTRKFIDEDFMLEFIEDGAKAIKYSHDRAIERKRQLLAETDEALDYFRRSNLDKKETLAYVRQLAEKVDQAIDRLGIVKNSAEYIFRSSMDNAVKKFFDGLERNPKEQRRFEKEQAKYDALAAKGKNPDWKVVPAALMDEDLAKKNIRVSLHALRDTYRKEIAAHDSFDSRDKMIALIDYMKEQASAVVYKVTRKMARARALKLLEEVGIPEPAIRYRQYPFEFSGGMRQRIVIAIALAANPDILICDEPTTALDVTIQSQILELINRIKAERNLSVIFITHDLGVVANMADRIAVMYAGKIVEYGTADDIFYDPRHPYTWALLSSMPDLDTKEKLEAIPGTPPNMIFPPKGDAFAARNKYALEIDFEEEPPMFRVSDTHFAATWLLHPDAPKVEPPRIVTERIERMSQKEVK